MKSISHILKAAKRKIRNLRFMRYRMDYAMPVLSYIRGNAGEILFDQKYERVSYPPLYIEDSIKTKPFVEKVEQYICELRNVKVVGSSNIVYARKGIIIYDLLCSNNPNYRITDIGFVRHNGHPIRIMGKYLSHYLKPCIHVETAINMVCNFSNNYYHFVMELMAKFFLLAKCHIPENIPLIVDEKIGEIPQMNEILRLFAGKRRVIYLGNNQICEINKLYCLSSVNQIIPNYVDDRKISFKDNMYCPEAICFIRNTLLSNVANDEKSLPKRVYIARKNYKNRSYNEKELIDIALKYGFEVISPEDYSAKEQFRLFSMADVVIAPSGAALTNIVCCKPNCKILVLYSQKLELSIFSSIAGCLNLDLRYLIGKSHDVTNLQSSFTIDEKSFKDSIINWLIKK